jgi:hypothetical protein
VARCRRRGVAGHVRSQGKLPLQSSSRHASRASISPSSRRQVAPCGPAKCSWLTIRGPVSRYLTQCTCTGRPQPAGQSLGFVSTIAARARSGTTAENDRSSGSTAKLEAPPRCHGWPAWWAGPYRCEVREAKALVENAPRARGVSSAVRRCTSS